MVIRNKVFAFIYRLALSCIGILSLVLIFLADSINKLDMNSLRYFGTITTLFTTVVIIMETIPNFFILWKKGKKIFQVYGQLLFAAVTLEIALLFAHPIYFAFVNGYNHDAILFTVDRFWPQFLVYLLFPVLTFFDWLLFSEKGNWKWHWVIYLMAIPLFYTAFSFLNHYVRTSTTFATLIFDPNTFINYKFLGSLNGWAGVIISSLTLLLTYIATTFLLIFLSFLVTGKYTRKRVISEEIAESI